MEMQDKERYQRIRDTLGQYCGIVELARVEEGDAVRWMTDYCTGRGVKIEADGARELVDALGGDMMMISNELEKLILYRWREETNHAWRCRDDGARRQAALTV